MKLHISTHCITIHLAENSPFSLHVKHFLTKKMSRSFWINDTLINFATPLEVVKRQAFLTKLYYTCATLSRTHNTQFLKKLLLVCHKPIKVICHSLPIFTHHEPEQSHHFYTILYSHHQESLQSIRTKYLRLAKQFHPDTLKSDDETTRQHYTEAFQKIQEAYAHIKAEKTKKRVA
ncbi:J domain-containing protein [Sulfurospirillum barnesii]|uniref:DnaJ-class molecular chaperone with C-terminal Zn finger domain n=1 Tax=Sulfurospirillum barnesii (strain ATCC 700032 / DSM 10660 / SES-3) TaxID=760154 RepID=I3XZL4_SULBS|nr:J domain-containing protein [Sulfurospirillum barnesii]AFL69388.1 DnaJ-class molecular chaperone with C-terminal Zn finger domain [Sulfurospirillum barnesii SES-3]